MPNLTVAQAVQAFTADPYTFLRKNYLSIASDNKAQTGVCTFVMMDNGTAYGFTNKMGKEKKKRQFWKVAWRSNGANANAPDLFEAHYIPMLQTENASHYALPSDVVSNCGLMITSQLTGCSFGLGSDANGTRLATHIQPNKGVAEGPARDQHLHQAVQGVFANDRLDSVHARQAGGYENSSTVVGIRTNNVWNFYVQNQTTTTGKIQTFQDGRDQTLKVTCPYLQEVGMLD